MGMGRGVNFNSKSFTPTLAATTAKSGCDRCVTPGCDRCISPGVSLVRRAPEGDAEVVEDSELEHPIKQTHVCVEGVRICTNNK